LDLICWVSVDGCDQGPRRSLIRAGAAPYLCLC
jgi:hypothetical protein